jgi:hypothetical protein
MLYFEQPNMFDKIAKYVGDVTASQCISRWVHVNPNPDEQKKVEWSAYEVWQSTIRSMSL